MAKAFIISTDGSITEVKPKDGKSFNIMELQGFVGGYIELQVGRIPIKIGEYTFKQPHFILNEEGKLMKLPYNPAATMLFQTSFNPGDFLVGNVLICEPPLIN